MTDVHNGWPQPVRQPDYPRARPATRRQWATTIGALLTVFGLGGVSAVLVALRESGRLGGWEVFTPSHYAAGWTGLAVILGVLLVPVVVSLAGVVTLGAVALTTRRRRRSR